MKKTMFALAGLTATALLAGSALADSASGPGGPVPDGNGSGVWQTALPNNPLVSTVVLNQVASIQSIVIPVTVTHTWMGDLQAILFDPSGTGYNIFVRPGFTGTGFGNSGDLLAGTYTYVDPTSGNPTLPSAGNSVPGSTYSQNYGGSGTGIWTNGNLNVFDTGMNSISGAAGVWTLKVYDWAGGDTGSIGSWTINYTSVPAPGALALLGLAGLVGGGRRRRS